MNILITGGLLGIAVLAILAAILLGMGENRSAKAPKDVTNSTINTNASALLPQQSRQSRVLKQPDGVAITPPIPATPIFSQSTDKLPTIKEHELRASLDGQIQEMTGELRNLTQRTSELEQRMDHLSTQFERNQQRQAYTSGQLHVPETDSQTS